jgi:hypothetical protein
MIWNEMPDMKCSRAEAASLIVEDIPYIIGGKSGYVYPGFNPLDSCEIFMDKAWHYAPFKLSCPIFGIATVSS